MSIEEAVERFNEVYKKNRKPLDTKSNFYCGITNDIEERETAHNATFLITMKANSFETAQDMEQALHDEGYDTGKTIGAGQQDSVNVFMYRKIPGVTKE